MQIVPLRAVPNQKVVCQLGGQSVTLNVYQQAYGLYMDVYVGATLIIGGVVCQNLNRIVRNLYLGFIGDFTFFDTQPPPNSVGQDPVYTGLGDVDASRFQLIYLETADIPQEV